jgi:tetratricopeptide (TPR) repeat protein
MALTKLGRHGTMLCALPTSPSDIPPSSQSLSSPASSSPVAIKAAPFLTQIRTIITDLLVIIAVTGTIYLVVTEVVSQSISISVVAVPEELAKRGFTEKAATELVRTELENIQATAALGSLQALAPLWESQRQNFIIPGTGFGIVDAAIQIKRAIGREDPVVTAYITKNRSNLSIAIKAIHAKLPTISRKASDELSAIRSIAEQIMRATQPYVLAGYYQETGHAREANALIREMHETLPFDNPERTYAHLFSGLIFTSQGEHLQAIAQYELAIQRDPSFAMAHNSLGNAYLRLWRYSEAVAAYDRAIALDDSYVNPRLNRAYTLFFMRRYDDAAAGYRAAVKLDPERDYTYIGLGNTLMALGKFEEAAEIFNQAISINPNSADAYLGVGQTLSHSGKFNEAVTMYRKAIAIDPRLILAHVRLSADLRCLQKMAESDSAFMAVRESRRY